MKKLILLLFLFTLYNCVQAQNHSKTKLGTTFSIGGKFGPETSISWFPMGEFGFYMNLQIPDENALGFIARLNFVADPIRYSISNDKWFKIQKNNIALDGLIVFPLKNENLKILSGIGLEYCLEPGIIYGTSTNESNNFYFRINTDSIQIKMNDNRRKLLPSFNIGMLYYPLRNKKFSAMVTIKPILLKLFSENIEIPYQLSNGWYNAVILNYKPVYIKLGINYDIW